MSMIDWAHKVSTGEDRPRHGRYSLPDRDTCTHPPGQRRHCTGCGVDVCRACSKHVYKAGMGEFTTPEGRRMLADEEPLRPTDGNTKCKAPDFETFDVDIHKCACGHLYGDHEYEWVAGALVIQGCERCPKGNGKIDMSTATANSQLNIASQYLVAARARLKVGDVSSAQQLCESAAMAISKGVEDMAPQLPLPGVDLPGALDG